MHVPADRWLVRRTRCCATTGSKTTRLNLDRARLLLLRRRSWCSVRLPTASSHIYLVSIATDQQIQSFTGLEGRWNALAHSVARHVCILVTKIRLLIQNTFIVFRFSECGALSFVPLLDSKPDRIALLVVAHLARVHQHISQYWNFEHQEWERKQAVRSADPVEQRLTLPRLERKP